MEKLKSIVVEVLNRATAHYIRRNNLKVIAVAGSIGKTSTVNAIRTVLAQKYRVHVPKTAYNTDKSVHLEIFDQQYATSIGGWLWVTAKMLLRSLSKADCEVLVIELGTDHPGEMRAFAFLKPDIGVLTAIAPEHMEHFKTIEAVSEEELTIAHYCDELVFNQQTVEMRFIPDTISQDITWYGADTDYRVESYSLPVGQAAEASADFLLKRYALHSVPVNVIGEHSLQALAAAGAVGVMCGMSEAELATGLRTVQSVKGRMQLLKGIGGSMIIDDSYNSSPTAVKAALDVLRSLDAYQRIAILGTMNEMGDYSRQAHEEVGNYCDPNVLDLVVTIGDEANDYLAVAAEKRGCMVKRFVNPYEAGEYVRQQLKPGTVVLVKGSQNRVFAEEAIKAFLADSADVTKLVRQSSFWMQQKRSQFGMQTDISS